MQQNRSPNGAIFPLEVDLKRISIEDQNRLVVSTISIDGVLNILSLFEDDTWFFSDGQNNIGAAHSSIKFKYFPEAYRQTIKEVTFCYLTRGREKTRRPKKVSSRHLVAALLHFIKYLIRIGSPNITEIPQLAFDNFVHESRNLIQKKTNKPLSKSALIQRFSAIEALYELSQHTKTPLSQHPWPDTSAVGLARRTGSNALHRQQSLTPLIPDEIFCALFKKSCEFLNKADVLFELRDKLENIDQLPLLDGAKLRRKHKLLEEHAPSYGPIELTKDLGFLRTACYIVIASTSGCRNHELTNLRNAALHKTYSDDNEVYHWMRSRSCKTYIGICDWMIPPIAARAIRIMERWAAPYQKNIALEINMRRKANPQDPEIARASKHTHSLFLAIGKSGNDGKTKGCRTITNSTWNRNLQAFVENTGLNWRINTHQFRRKFANYAAHSKLGDLRYLKEHFKHWTMEMTLLYAMDDTWGQHYDLDLLFEVESEEKIIKEDTVHQWIDAKTLSGGYGRSLKRWQRDPLNLAIFKDQSTMVKSIAESTAIRSNGHAWCTADDTGCVGNTVERSRCGECPNSVISHEQAAVYKALYRNLQSLQDCKDIGEPGIMRVNRDLKRYASVLGDLGINMETDLEQPS
ncbi:integrase [Pseudomonas sp. CJQ_11]|uniref:integrase n=1 Tax=Pseudomonas sp. CJQ_11 TaxID=3367169 RepID=UPI00370A8E98